MGTVQQKLNGQARQIHDQGWWSVVGKGKWLRIKITVLKNGGVQNMPRKSSSVPPWTFDDVYNSCSVLSDLHRMLSPCLYYVVYA